ncbi:heat-inducible transcriptional repressor [Kineosphaera limosa]|uniref:Heat-inducible transcription repressor HrcA n=1 Tax=Kineosphaera limosa NBRC 100340 TaxID=1184609 RepID=K6X6F0_9MICO|nr:heat-inducible transcriptional repressor HrcA [Kineosphaera limosa]NYE02938.1 heat-inducible transcriptional repressor [Kineosphaera limosa]GAB94369.1 heat-inducible transcription repressor HrcA [Kineosphaera limosa NBRC 100340]
MTTQRRLAVLRAIVQDYVDTSEPVGSKSLIERHALGVSAATVRNDMAILEEEGLITAPHTSAGRVPTDAGYRAFVDQLGTLRPLSPAQRTAIQRFLEGAVDLDDVVDRTVRLLASLTRQVAVMQYPSLSRSSVRHIELLPIGPARAMVVLILDTGRVEQRIVESEVDLGTPGADEMLRRIRTVFNAQAVGQTLVQAAARLASAPDALEPGDRPLARAFIQVLDDALVEEREERVVLAGTANLARFDTDFPMIGPVLEALEEHMVLLNLFGALAADPSVDPLVAASLARHGGLAVTIGHENPHAGLAATSVISTGYGAGDDVVAGLGVLGPTRMDYAGTMASVRAVARYVSRLLES